MLRRQAGLSGRLELPIMPLVVLGFGWFAWKRLGALKTA